MKIVVKVFDVNINWECVESESFDSCVWQKIDLWLDLEEMDCFNALFKGLMIDAETLMHLRVRKYFDKVKYCELWCVQLWVS